MGAAGGAERLAALGWTAEGGRPHTIANGGGSRSRESFREALVGGWAEDFADFAGEALQGEGFLQESFLAVGGGGAGEGVLGVAGEVEDFDAGARGQELLDEFVAAEAGHDNVGDDKVDGVGVVGGEG